METQIIMNTDSNKSIDDIVNMLDSLMGDDFSRVKIDIDNSAPDASFKKEYHHGRCDVGSPWARGCSFDLLEPED